MGVNSLPKTVTRQRRGCDLNTRPTAPESSTLTTRLPVSHPNSLIWTDILVLYRESAGDGVGGRLLLRDSVGVAVGQVLFAAVPVHRRHR